MYTTYAFEKIAEQRQGDDERAAAAYRLALQAERAARGDGAITAPRFRTARLLSWLADLVARRPARANPVTVKSQAR